MSFSLGFSLVNLSKTSTPLLNVLKTYFQEKFVPRAIQQKNIAETDQNVKKKPCRDLKTKIPRLDSRKREDEKNKLLFEKSPLESKNDSIHPRRFNLPFNEKVPIELNKTIERNTQMSNLTMDDNLKDNARHHRNIEDVNPKVEEQINDVSIPILVFVYSIGVCVYMYR